MHAGDAGVDHDSWTEALDIYFEFEKDQIERRSNQPGAALNRTAEQRLRRLLADGYRVQSIIGRTSPEGPQQPRRPGGFNNQQLSEERAEAARQLAQRLCGRSLLQMRQPSCFMSDVTIEGRGELFSSDERPGK